MRRRDILAATASTALIGSLVACEAEQVQAGAKIATDRGAVKGAIVDGVHRFLGIPFAEPPFGARRFKPPVPRFSWNGTFDALEYGEICPQTGGMGNAGRSEGEDNLNLNLWTPDPTAKGLPVMVWAHGGGQMSGSGAQPTYDGTNFAKEGVVLITNNRRLGAEGYLYLEQQFGATTGPGNLGILDQIEVLRWVQRNIEQFGGDPNNVTLFGESGGAAATQAVVATAGSAGLLHRVILQSGGHSAQLPVSATALTKLALQKLGVAEDDLAALQALPWQRYIDVYEDLHASGHGQPQVYIPVLGASMPIHPVDACTQGIGADIDYLVGTCAEEMNLFDAFPGDAALTAFRARAKKLLVAANLDSNAVRSGYKEIHSKQGDKQAELALLGDLWFRVPGIRIAEGHVSQTSKRSTGHTYMYRFDWEAPVLGAAHGMDLLMFGNGLPIPGLTSFSDHEALAKSMRSSWVNFARTGDPSIAEHSWPEYTTDRRLTMSINSKFDLLQDPFRAQRALLGELLTMSWQERQI